MRKSSLALIVLLSCSILLPYTASSLAPFNDEFSSPSLNEGWIWSHEPQNWSIQSGWLIVTSTLGTNFWSRVDTGNFLYELITGDFTVETKVSATLTSNYQQTGLMIRQDTNNWVKINFEYSGGLTVKTGINRDGTASVETRTSLPAGTSLVWLKASRNGDAISASYSLDGSTWNQHYSGSRPLGETLMVGLCVTDSNSRVSFQSSFDYFHYSALVLSDVSPPTIDKIRLEPNKPTSDDEATITASVTDTESGLREVNLHYSTNEGTTWNKVSMSSIGDSDYRGAAPTQGNTTIVWYYIEAFDYGSNQARTTTNSYTVKQTPDKAPPVLGNISHQPNNPTSDDDVYITTSVTDLKSSVKEVNLYYSTNGGISWTKVSMNNTGGSDYAALIPRHKAGGKIQYYVEASDTASNQARTTTSSINLEQSTATNPLIDLFSLTLFIGAIIAAAIIALMLRRNLLTSRTQPSDSKNDPTSKTMPLKQIILRCPRCRTELSLEATSCPSCGMSLPITPQSPTSTYSSSSN